MMIGLGTSAPGTVSFPPAGLAEQCGATPVKDSTGLWTCPNSLIGMSPQDIANCTSLYYLKPTCWAYDKTAWEQAAVYQSFGDNLPMPTPPPPVDLANTQNSGYSGTPAQQEAQYAAEVNKALTQGSDASKAAMLLYYQTNGPNVAPDCGMLGGSPQLQDDGVNWKCSGLGGLSTTTILIAAAAIGGLIILTSRR